MSEDHTQLIQRLCELARDKGYEAKPNRQFDEAVIFVPIRSGKRVVEYDKVSVATFRELRAVIGY